jgi:hypothetical protein
LRASTCSWNWWKWWPWAKWRRHGVDVNPRFLVFYVQKSIIIVIQNANFACNFDQSNHFQALNSPELVPNCPLNKHNLVYVFTFLLTYKALLIIRCEASMFFGGLTSTTLISHLWSCHPQTKCINSHSCCGKAWKKILHLPFKSPCPLSSA